MMSILKPPKPKRLHASGAWPILSDPVQYVRAVEKTCSERQGENMNVMQISAHCRIDCSKQNEKVTG